MPKETDQYPPLAAGQGMGGRKGRTAIGTEYPGGSGGRRGGESGLPTAEEQFDPGEEARSFVKLWTSAISEEALEEFNSRFDNANSSDVVRFGNAISSHAPEAFKERQNQLLESMNKAGYRHFVKQIIYDIHTACLITDGAYPADYIPVGAFGINLVNGEYGPFVHNKERRIATLRDIEVSLVWIHSDMLKKEKDPKRSPIPGYPGGIAEITAGGYRNILKNELPPEIEV